MFCRKCGKQIPDDSVFCPKCGEKVAVDSIVNNDTKVNATVEKIIPTDEDKSTVPTTKSEFFGLANDKSVKIVSDEDQAEKPMGCINFFMIMLLIFFLGILYRVFITGH